MTIRVKTYFFMSYNARNGMMQEEAYTPDDYHDITALDIVAMLAAGESGTEHVYMHPEPPSHPQVAALREKMRKGAELKPSGNQSRKKLVGDEQKRPKKKTKQVTTSSSSSTMCPETLALLKQSRTRSSGPKFVRNGSHRVTVNGSFVWVDSVESTLTNRVPIMDTSKATKNLNYRVRTLLATMAEAARVTGGQLVLSVSPPGAGRKRVYVTGKELPTGLCNADVLQGLFEEDSPK